MSYEAWGEPDDVPDLPEGAIDPEEAEQLRDLFKHVDMPDPRPGNTSDAALIMIDHLLHHVEHYPPKPEDPTVTWAKALLKSKGIL